MVWVLKFFLQKCEITHNSCAVSNIGFLHTLNLSWSLAGFQVLNLARVVDDMTINYSANFRVALLEIDANLLLVGDLLLEEVRQILIGLNLALKQV